MMISLFPTMLPKKTKMKTPCPRLRARNPEHRALLPAPPLASQTTRIHPRLRQRTTSLGLPLVLSTQNSPRNLPPSVAATVTSSLLPLSSGNKRRKRRRRVAKTRSTSCRMCGTRMVFGLGGRDTTRGRCTSRRKRGRRLRRSRSRYGRICAVVEGTVLISISSVLGDQAEPLRYRLVLPERQIPGAVRRRRADRAPGVRPQVDPEGKDEHGRRARTELQLLGGQVPCQRYAIRSVCGVLV